MLFYPKVARLESLFALIICLALLVLLTATGPLMQRSERWIGRAACLMVRLEIWIRACCRAKSYASFKLKSELGQTVVAYVGTVCLLCQVFRYSIPRVR